jgi:hypothetical protein
VYVDDSTPIVEGGKIACVDGVISYRLNDPWFDFQQAKQIFLFRKTSRPASCSVSFRALSLLVKQPEREADHSPLFRADVKDKWQYTLITSHMLTRHVDRWIYPYIYAYNLPCKPKQWNCITGLEWISNEYHFCTYIYEVPCLNLSEVFAFYFLVISGSVAIYTISHRFTSTGCQVTVLTEFCTAAPNICGCSVWMLVHITLLAHRILKWLLGFWRICAPMPKIRHNMCFFNHFF